MKHNPLHTPISCRQAAFLLPALLLAACDSRVAWTDSISIPEDGWTPERPVVFCIDPKAYEPDDEERFAKLTSKAVGDTVPRLRGDFEAGVSLRYRDDCNAREIKLVAETASLDAEILTDTLSFRLFADDGHPLGHGRFGIYEVSVAMPRLLHAGEGTTVSLIPLRYDHPATGIMSATLILTHPGSRKSLFDHNVSY